MTITLKNPVVKSIEEQVAALRMLKIHEHIDTCDQCGLQGVFMYRKASQALCPDCDYGLIEDYKQGN